MCASCIWMSCGVTLSPGDKVAEQSDGVQQAPLAPLLAPPPPTSHPCPICPSPSPSSSIHPAWFPSPLWLCTGDHKSLCPPHKIVCLIPLLQVLPHPRMLRHCFSATIDLSCEESDTPSVPATPLGHLTRCAGGVPGTQPRWLPR